MNRAIIISVLIFVCFEQKGQCQPTDTLLTHDRFLGIRIGETNFKSAGTILKEYSYKDPMLNFRNIHWRNGGHSTLFIHHYYIKIENSKLQVTLYGYATVDRIQIISQGQTTLSYQGLTLGRSRIGDIKLTGDNWESIVDADGKKYLTHEFGGIRIDISGDSLDVLNDRWRTRKIDRITLTKERK
jgi:hypothetical protein